MTNTEFLEKLKNIAENYKTKYMWGTFGSVIDEKIIEQKIEQYPNHYSTSREEELRSLTGEGYWAFDCVGLIKGIAWGWSGNTEENYGGAVYQSNGVDDLTASGMFDTCRDISDDFSNIPVGAALHIPGHIGIYAGGDTVVQATLGQNGDGVVITPLSANKWVKHGKLPFITYGDETQVLPGDVNGDGKVDDEDVITLKRYISNYNDISINEKNSDMNGDGEINDEDVILLQRKISGVTPAPNKPIQAGSIVKIREGAYVYGTEKAAASWVYKENWVVTKISILNKNKVLIGDNEKGTNNINTWFYLADLTAV